MKEDKRKGERKEIKIKQIEKVRDKGEIDKGEIKEIKIIHKENE